MAEWMCHHPGQISGEYLGSYTLKILVANWAFTLEILRTLDQNELDFAFATRIYLSEGPRQAWSEQC
jgi:hypothetical protein